jgi:hypothetical protein
MNEPTWFELSTHNGLEIKPASGKGQVPAINLHQGAVLYTYARRHQVIRIQFAADAIRLEHADGLIERFLKFEDLEKEVTKLEKPKAKRTRKPKKVDWHKIQDVEGILQHFPKNPTADELLDLFERNRVIRSNKLENYIRKLSATV